MILFFFVRVDFNLLSVDAKQGFSLERIEQPFSGKGDVPFLKLLGPFNFSNAGVVVVAGHNVVGLCENIGKG